MIRDVDTRPPSIFLIRLFYYLVVFFLFVALLNNQWELTLLGFLIVAMVGGVKLWSRLSLKNIDYRPEIATDRLFPGDAVDLTIPLVNAKPLPVWVQLRVDVDSRLRPHESDSYLSGDTWVLWYQRITMKFGLIARRRGVHTIGPFEIRGGDLLGFFSRGKVFQKTRQVVVYPRLRRLKPIDLPRRDFFGTPGATHPVEDPIYLLGTRDYQYLRPAKFIHWKASARLNRLQEKLCEPSAQEKVLLVIDVIQFEQREAADDFEQMLEAAASVAAQIDRRGLAMGLVTNGQTIDDYPAIVPISQGAHQLSRILETMARLEMRAESRIEDVLLSGIGLTSGVSFAHFSYHRDAQTRESERVFEILKLQGAFFVCRPNDDFEQGVDTILPNVNLLNDVFIQAVQ